MDHQFKLLVDGGLVAGASTFEVKAATVWLKQHLAIEPGIPFRGARQSGLGAELGDGGLKEYTQAQIVNAVAFA